MRRTNVPLLVCVSADVEVRERVVRRLSDCGAVLICSDLRELRAMLFPPGSGPAPDMINLLPESDVAVGPVTFGELTIDAAGHAVSWRGRPLPLTRLERALLARLASPPVGVWSYERLFSAVWDSAYLGDSSILHSAVKRLRRKLRTAAADGGPSVQTVRGIGYRLTLDP